MKRLWSVLLLPIAMGAFSQERYLAPYEPYGPEVLAQGGSYVAVAQGWNSLFSNPAGFACKTGNMFYLTSNTGTFLRLSDISKTVAFLKDGSFQNFNLFAPPPNPVLEFVSDVTTQNGLGFQETLGLGWVGNGLGLALVLDSQLFGRDQSLMATNLEFVTSASLIAGYAVSFVLAKPPESEGEPIVDEFGQIPEVKPDWVLHVGGSTRVSYLYWSEYSVLNLLSLLSGGSLNLNHPLYTFPLISLSLGLLLEGRYLSVGLSVTDIGGMDLGDRKNNLSAVLSSFLLPTSGPKDNVVFVYPTVVRFGVGWTPDFGEFAEIVQPKLHLETRVPIQGLQTPMWLTWFRLGGELRLVNFLFLRAGYGAGNVTAGAGFHFFDLWELNLSFSTEELGQYIGDKRRSRLQLESMIRF